VTGRDFHTATKGNSTVRKRVAALYDIHGNLAALEAVAAEIERIGVDAIIAGGDLVSGPSPGETLALLRQLPADLIFVRGNADREVVESIGRQETEFEPGDVDARRTVFATNQLAPEALSFLGSLPLTETVEIAGFGPTLFCHATPRRDDETFTERSPQSRIAEIFAGVDEAIVVCGHTHMQFDLVNDNRRIINAGSVGQPFEGRPGAYWALFADGSLDLRRMDYNYARARQLIEKSGYPFADMQIADLFDAPPTREEALLTFEPR